MNRIITSAVFLVMAMFSQTIQAQNNQGEDVTKKSSQSVSSLYDQMRTNGQNRNDASLGKANNQTAENLLKPSLKYPSWFMGVQGGIVNSTSDPIFSISVGTYLSPVFGLRFNLAYSNIKGDDNDLQDWNLINPNLDVMLNLVNLFKKDVKSKFEAALIIGAGVHYADGSVYCSEPVHSKYSTTINHYLVSANTRAGILLGYKINDKWSLNAEGQMNRHLLSPKACDVLGYNGSDMRAYVGLTYHFARDNKKEEPAVDMSASKSLYEQMQARVQTRMENWMRQMKGESKEAYLARMHADTLSSVRLQFETEEATLMAGDLINKSSKRFGKYSIKDGKLTVDVDGMESIILDVPKDEIRDFGSAKDIKFGKTVYRLNKNNEFEVLYTEVLQPKNSKTYTYNRESRSLIDLDNNQNFIPLNVAQETITNEIRLEEIKEEAVKQAKDENYITDNTLITVDAEVISSGNDHYDYKVSYKYTVKDEFSTHDDFAPGKYQAEESNASVAMLKIIRKAFETNLANFIKAGKACSISFTGTADAMPIRGLIAYNGKYGDIVDQVVIINGKEDKLTVTKKTGIRSNEQLSLVRAVSVKDYIYNHVKGLREMKTTNDYNLEVSEEKGSQHRRVKVDFYFHDAY